MKMFSKFLLSAVALAGVSLEAAEAQTYSKLEKFTGANKFLSDTGEGFRCQSGAAKTSFFLFGKKHVAVEAGKKYKVSCDFRLIPGGEESGTFHFGIDCYAKDGRSINVREVNAHDGTQTELAAAVKKGDKVLKVKDASKWIPRYPVAAFNVKADYSDLPNTEYSPGISKIEKTGDCWTLTLKAPMTKDYPAGTTVRNHADGATYRYVCGGVKVTPQWTTRSVTYSGFAKSEWDAPGTKFRAGTVAITPVLFPTSSTPFNVEFRNIKIEEVK